MRFPREVECTRETAGEIRFQFGYLVCIKPSVPFGSRREAIELACIARGGDDKCPLLHDLVGQRRLPPLDGCRADAFDFLVGTFALTPGRQHAAGKPGCAGANPF